MRALLAALVVLALGAAGGATATLAVAHPGSLTDRDHDSVQDAPDDNCPDAYNPTQEDLDRDSLGDACDPDDDADGADDAIDVCPAADDPEQRDTDGDGLGDRCDDEDDGDGVRDRADNCPTVANPDQADHDDDFIGNACDTDVPPGLRPGEPEPDPSDRSAPALGVLVDRTHSAEDARSGIVVEVRCSEACALAGELRRGRAVLGRDRGKLRAAGRTFLFLRTTRRPPRRGMRAAVRVVASDPSGNRTTTTRTTTVRP